MDFITKLKGKSKLSTSTTNSTSSSKSVDKFKTVDKYKSKLIFKKNPFSFSKQNLTTSISKKFIPNPDSFIIEEEEEEEFKENIKVHSSSKKKATKKNGNVSQENKSNKSNHKKKKISFSAVNETVINGKRVSIDANLKDIDEDNKNNNNNNYERCQSRAGFRKTSTKPTIITKFEKKTSDVSTIKSTEAEISEDININDRISEYETESNDMDNLTERLNQASLDESLSFPQSLSQPSLQPPSPYSSIVEEFPKFHYELDDFIVLQTIGMGSFGRVHLARLKANGEYYALKVMKKEDIIQYKQVEHILNEKHILEQINHPFIVNMLCGFQDNTNIYIVTEFSCGGELFSFLRAQKYFTNDIAKFYAAEVIVVFEYLHSKDIIYRDLKPENILLDETGHIRLIDFGFAKHVTDVTYTLCGTPDYLAPEIIQSKPYSQAVDWYALGVLIYEMLAGYPPFYKEDHVELYQQILEGKYSFPSQINHNARDLIRKLLQPDLSKRYGNLKGGVDDIKNHKWFAGVNWDHVENKLIVPPYIPRCRYNGDTSHFDQYPEDYEPYDVQKEEDIYADVFKDF